ncbi:MAG: heme exporter protein CcmB, partial [Actinomycetota bacterium]
DRSGLFLAKAAANLVYLVAVEILLIGAFTIFFGFDVVTHWAVLLLLVVLIDLGFVSVGTLLASVAAQTRSRELLLPILALPLLVPVFIAAVELSSDLFLGRGLEQVAARGWFAILVTFDVIAAAVAALTFEFVVD